MGVLGPPGALGKAPLLLFSEGKLVIHLLSLEPAPLSETTGAEDPGAMGEETLGGVLKKGLPVKMGADIPPEYSPDFIGGAAHTAHPNVCAETGHLVGWHWWL